MNYDDRDPLRFEHIAYNKTDAAAAVGLSVASIDLAVRTKELIPHYLGRKPLFRAVDLDAWIRSLPTESPAERRA